MTAAAEMTPSGVPPMPHSRSTGERSVTASSAAETSPWAISRTRAPASRIAAIPSLVAGAVEHHDHHVADRAEPLRSAISFTVSPSGRSRSSRSAMSGAPAIFSMYTQGPGSNIVPRAESAITASALGIP